ncbi:hypothetical protein Esti_003295 [Eimeria stiedai]
MESHNGEGVGFAGKPSSQKAQGMAQKRQSVGGFVAPPDAAGVPTGRITELTLHTRKRTDWNRRGCGSIRYITEPVEAPVTPPHTNKKTQLRYCGFGPEEQRQHFQTRWKPVDGKMEFCTGRRGGSATVECDYECIDRENTYHTWKRMAEAQKNTASHLQFDRFLTVVEAAERSDRLPDVKNRNPPLPNKDGPFEKPRPHGGNLDRTYVPREDAKRRDNFVGFSKRPTGLDTSHLQLSTLHNRTGADRGEMRHGLKRNQQSDHAFDFVLPPDSSVPAAKSPLNVPS